MHLRLLGFAFIGHQIEGEKQMTFTITYGKTVHGIHIEYSQTVNENNHPEAIYKQVKAFVDQKFRELEKNFEV